ncbi:MAG: non-canonical purine NTP pyrophosphatase, RdgB/HAM1 family [Bdellovibrio sp.]|nr:MAG: non-canonical purine NTP pyrophosphatase, RdgB/HAM1 family [Bdellovibrio sp.]
MDVWIGTSNKGKLSELSLQLQKEVPQAVIFSLKDLPHYTPPPENGKSFLENARIKARSLRSMKPGNWIIAEDSGLEVEALGGLPGIHSARYAGAKATDSENVAKLLKMMQIKGAMTQAARFFCQMVAYTPAGEEILCEGELKGNIATAQKGSHGFGYDPVFIPQGESKTLAELGAGYKVQHSHRSEALRKLLPRMKA